MNSTVLNRQPHDEWYLSLYKQMLLILPSNSECFYFWSIDPNWTVIKDHKFTAEFILLFVVDTLQYNSDYDFYRQTRTEHAQTIIDIANQHKDKLIIVSTCINGLDAEINLPNVRFICHSGMLTGYEGFRELPLIINKDLDSKYVFLCLNRSPRMYRLISTSYMLGKNLDNYGYISFDHSKISMIDNWLDVCNWILTKEQQTFCSNIVTTGFNKLKTGQSTQSLDDVNLLFKQAFNNNALNFYNLLSNIYKQTFVQIVTESSFCEPLVFVTEKFLQSIYGANFPILLAPTGTVKHLREVGFDMFDDIINHSYDMILNPFDRITSAIEDNLDLLTNYTRSKELWLNCQQRFIKNCDFARKDMYNYYTSTSLLMLKDILDQYDKK